MQHETSETTTAVSTQNRQRWGLLLLLLALLGVFLLSLFVGSVRIPLDEIVRVLLGGAAERETWSTIVLKVRLPKAVTAVLAGSALSVSGLQMQTMFRNPLAGPFVLGINSGASLGVALVVLAVGTGSTLLAGLGLLSDFGIVVAASLGAGLVLFLVLAVARRVETMTLLILGLMFGYATSALVSVLLYFSIAERIQAYIAWTFGSFGGVTWRQMQVMAPAVLLGLAIAWLSAKPLNALLLGETYAQSLGLSVRRARLGVLVSASLMAGAITAFCGPIGFVGVAVPHLCRSLFGTSNHRLLVPATILLGGIVALVADLLAQLPGSQITLPLNAVTALIGAPVVTWVILRQRNLRSSFAG
ncbi:MAG: iron ABC transporter permease [Ardenticatenaceae bacterium]|nr:iron ABC transporter permease [Anaerolineales bacterium]MCB8941985.1 iron ABC transporter permease [Ardenticatenaceae bacterium]MCB8973098.1 iron ABC transporter permease [Ardenticatenaceae bacterium]